ANFECYEQGRFFTVTGNRIGSFDTLRDCTESIKPLYLKYLARQEEKTFLTTPTHSSIGETLNDKEVIEKASRNERFDQLYNYGSIGDASKDDMTLINILIFWTSGNAAQIDRIYRSSALRREKWDRKQSGSTYGQMTINKCLRTYRGSFYSSSYYK
ncbi:MAG: hypothetical protein Q4F66_12625, partial [Clostridium sp.]|nr:hypothetical protein [Clostridium sp.]